MVSVVEEMMQRITKRNEYNVQYHGSLIEEEQVTDPKHFLYYPSCHRPDNDCFIDHLGEERYIDMTCTGKILRTPPKFTSIINGRISMVYRKNGRQFYQ